MALKLKTLLDIGRRLLRLHRFRTRLKNKELVVLAIEAPFNVHGSAVMLLNDAGVLGQFNDLVIR